MMEKIFLLRVDVESDKGIREGLPKLLDLLKKYNIKASFYLTMGGESNILELIRYRRLQSSSERALKVWSKREKARMAFLPKDFVRANLPILRRILSEGHELGIHGWKHRAWTRGIDKIDINDHVRKSISKYISLFGQRPISFCAPAFNTNKEVLSVLESNGIEFISDFNDKAPKKYGKMTNVPITISGQGMTPIIEFLVAKGRSDTEIADAIKKRIMSEDFSSLYIHDLYEARFKLGILEDIFRFVANKKIKVKRVIDF